MTGTVWEGHFRHWTLTDSYLKIYPNSFSNEHIYLEELDKLPRQRCVDAIDLITNEIKEKVSRFQRGNVLYPVVLVGGGSPMLVNRSFGKYQKVIHPAGYHISNAVGACFAPHSAQIDKVFWIKEKTKQEIIEMETSSLFNQLIKKGVNKDNMELISVEEFPFDYMAEDVLRLRLKVLGDP